MSFKMALEEEVHLYIFNLIASTNAANCNFLISSNTVSWKEVHSELPGFF